MEEIIKVLNKYIEKNYNIDGRFISSKNFVTNKNFKSFKTYFLNLYYVVGKNSIPIIQEEVIVKSTSEKVDDYLRQKFLEAVFDYVDSNEFKDLVDGRINI